MQYTSKVAVNAVLLVPCCGSLQHLASHQIDAKRCCLVFSFLSRMYTAFNPMGTPPVQQCACRLVLPTFSSMHASSCACDRYCTCNLNIPAGHTPQLSVCVYSDVCITAVYAPQQSVHYSSLCITAVSVALQAVHYRCLCVSAVTLCCRGGQGATAQCPVTAILCSAAPQEVTCMPRWTSSLLLCPLCMSHPMRLSRILSQCKGADFCSLASLLQCYMSWHMWL